MWVRIAFTLIEHARPLSTIVCVAFASFAWAVVLGNICCSHFFVFRVWSDFEALICFQFLFADNYHIFFRFRRPQLAASSRLVVHARLLIVLWLTSCFWSVTHLGTAFPKTSPHHTHGISREGPRWRCSTYPRTVQSLSPSRLRTMSSERFRFAYVPVWQQSLLHACVLPCLVSNLLHHIQLFLKQ